MSHHQHHLCGCVPGHRMTTLVGTCLDCGFTEMKFFNDGNRPCEPMPPTPHLIKTHLRPEDLR